MNSGLLNIWREIGAYLRYGDAKCIFLSGLSFGLLLSFFRFKLIDSSASWEIFGRIAYISISPPEWTALTAFGLAFLIPALAIIPSISGKLLYANILNSIGNYLSTNTSSNKEKNIIYFLNISAFRTEDSYEEALRSRINIPENFNKADKELISQIWIISRIATSKFIAANISVIGIIVGLFFAFW